MHVDETGENVLAGRINHRPRGRKGETVAPSSHATGPEFSTSTAMRPFRTMMSHDEMFVRSNDSAAANDDIVCLIAHVISLVIVHAGPPKPYCIVVLWSFGPTGGRRSWQP